MSKWFHAFSSFLKMIRHMKKRVLQADSTKKLSGAE